ncbi:hypothetical protein GCM10010495_69970 [Kitasatospora herbaricolor]|nr:hypothetical protein GCM10010495_69970 [Kitasatospora herbaricolor]
MRAPTLRVRFLPGAGSDRHVRARLELPLPATSADGPRCASGKGKGRGNGWLASMQEYADCLNQNGAQGIKVDKARGGLDLSSVLPPEAVRKCQQYNPVYKQGGAEEKRP